MRTQDSRIVVAGYLLLKPKCSCQFAEKMSMTIDFFRLEPAWTEIVECAIINDFLLKFMFIFLQNYRLDFFHEGFNELFLLVSAQKSKDVISELELWSAEDPKSCPWTYFFLEFLPQFSLENATLDFFYHGLNRRRHTSKTFLNIKI